MCGITGIIAADTAASVPKVRAMLSALRHRGPDGEGVVAYPGVVLGHRRLSIIDLSPAASQPMRSADGTRHIVLNGEIYNYLELRAELETLGHRFRTRSDTEVLLEGWGAWGRAVLQKVVGMFAFALLDTSRRVLVLARDPFAIKPLYYVRTREFLAFASEIPPLLDLPGVSCLADAGAVSDFLARGANHHAGRTMFADVGELPGAHWAEIALDQPAMKPVCYWHPPEHQRLDLSFDDAAAGLRELLRESVRYHLRSDVPVGTLLSGGQDSSSVLTLAREVLGPDAPLHAFSYRGDAGETDEGRWIELARGAAKATGHEIRVSASDLARDLPAVIRSQAEPFSSPVIYAQRRLFEAAAESGVKVVLDGQGSDEYLGGYSRFYPGRLASLLHQHRYLEFARVAASVAADGPGWGPAASALALRWPAIRGLRRSPAPPALLAPEWSESAPVSLPYRPTGPGPLRQMLGASLSDPGFAWLMRYADRSAMASSIENRLPFLSARIVDFALSLPEEYAIGRDALVKQLLRAAMRSYVPAPIRERRDKIGFDVPAARWLLAPGLPEQVKHAMEIPAVKREYAAALSSMIDTAAPMSRAHAFDAWRLVTLSAWSDAFGVRWT